MPLTLEEKRAQSRVRMAKLFAENPQKFRDRTNKYKSENPEKVRASKATYRAANLEKTKAAIAAHKVAHPEMYRAYNAARKAGLSQACPSWVDRAHLAFIYANCPDGYHVDHAEPLNGKLSSGLHVPANLQYLPASVNCSKGNRCVDVSTYAIIPPPWTHKQAMESMTCAILSH